MRKLTPFIIIFLFNSALSAQVPGMKWVKKLGASSADYGQSVAVDREGNSYTTGAFSGSVDFDPGVGVSTFSSAAAGDVFVRKLDPLGNFIWAATIAGTGDDMGYDIDVDASGNILVGGIHSGVSDFDPGAATASLTANGHYDYFLWKLDKNGKYLWAKATGGTSADVSYAIDTDPQNNVYISGYFTETIDLDPGPGTDSRTSKSGSPDLFVCKFNASGAYQWGAVVASNNDEFVYAIQADVFGNILVTGLFTGTVDFDPGAGTTNLTATNYNDAFLFKLNSGGSLVWARKFGGQQQEVGYAVTSDISGNVYCSGYFQSTCDFNPGASTANHTSLGAYDIFVVKLDSAGSYQWSQSVGGTATEVGYDLDIDAMGDLIMVGYFSGTVDFDPGVSTSSHTSVGGNDIFLMKLDLSGNFKWVQCIGGTGSDVTRRVAVSPKGSILVSGYFSGTVDFDPGAGTTNLSSSGAADVFTVKFCSPNAASTSIAACEFYKSPSNKYTWTSTGNYTDTLVNSDGCDSILTVNLTIKKSSSGFFTAANCYSYLSPSGKYTWTSSGTYYDTLVNGAGCDSVISVELTIHQNTSSTIYPELCEPYKSPSGKYVWTISGNYSDTIPNANGCDSIISIELNVHLIDTTIELKNDTFTANYDDGDYQWIDCLTGEPVSGEESRVFVPLKSGFYGVIIEDGNCVDTSECRTLVKAGFGAQAELPYVYPQPAGNELFVYTYSNSVYRIFDAGGRVVVSGVLIRGRNTLRTGDLLPGFYYLELRNENGTQSIKLLKN